jgi:competence protein ComEA
MVDREKLRLAGWVAAALVAVLLGARLLGGGGGGEAAGVTVDPAGAGARGAPAAGRAGGRPGSAEVFVQVAGEVARPGVYRVPAGSRVTDAVARAGGLTRRADQAGVNLVARVQDGQQVIVPRRGAGAAVAGGVASPGAGASAPATPISLSSATVAQLDTLDGIGPTLAQRIVEYRQAHGGFSSVDQLRQVSGIGEKRFAALRKAVTP